MHPAAPHHLPFFIPGADGSDTLMVVMGIFLIATILWVGTLYWKLHSLPERVGYHEALGAFALVVAAAEVAAGRVEQALVVIADLDTVYVTQLDTCRGEA